MRRARTCWALVLAAVGMSGLAACGSTPLSQRRGIPTPTPTSSPVPAPSTTSTSSVLAPTTSVPVPTHLGRGDSGPAVSALQAELVALGYWLGPTDGTFGSLTEQALEAVQKAAGLPSTGVLGPTTRQAIDDGVRPVPRDTGSGIEVDLARQLVLVVAHGQLRSAMTASTGSGRPYTMDGVTYTSVTPTGHFTIFRRVDGWDASPLGSLWRPAYFSGGVALHGYEDVPSAPASHGCVRVSTDAMDWLWSAGQVEVGTPVWVY